MQLFISTIFESPDRKAYKINSYHIKMVPIMIETSLSFSAPVPDTVDTEDAREC